MTPVSPVTTVTSGDPDLTTFTAIQGLTRTSSKPGEGGGTVSASVVAPDTSVFLHPFNRLVKVRKA